MHWTDNYDPLGNLILSSLVAAVPVVVLLGLLAFWHVRAQIAALAGLIAALGIAVLVYHMPAPLAGMAAVNGAVFGLFPIGWIVLNAMFVYNLSVETGQFAVLQRQIASVSSDRRIQALLIAFSFGAFIALLLGWVAETVYKLSDQSVWHRVCDHLKRILAGIGAPPTPQLLGKYANGVG